MSILLESLKQSKSEESNDVPSLADSHFDDDMLSDEWLLARIKKWQLAVVMLAVVLVILFVSFIYQLNEAKAEITKLEIELTQLLPDTARPLPGASRQAYRSDILSRTV